MATVAAPVEKVRPPWVSNLGGQLFSVLLAFVVALFIGALIIIGYGENPLTVYGTLVRFAFKDVDSFGYVLQIATPLIFSALAIAVCFKGGLFNIGVEGQYLVGMLTASWAALTFDFLPGPLLMWTALLFAMLGGMIWAAIPAVLKVKTGAHEVVTTIMLNGIAVNLLGWALNGPLKYRQEGGQVAARTANFKDNALVPDLGHLFGMRESVHLSWLLPLGFVAAAIVWFVIRRMRLGYEARAVGSTPGSARAGGISVGAVQIKLFMLSGALAGLIGMQQLLADKGYLPVNFVSQLGFTGIAVAFLGQNNPVGIVAASVVWGVLSRGESALQLETDVPREFVIILQGILILSVMVIYQITRRRLARRQLQAAAVVEQVPEAA
ncbi:MAG TPA: ABC transporter permease [Actinomycetota bacterium]|jgi:simple sugar transport system permease protein